MTGKSLRLEWASLAMRLQSRAGLALGGQTVGDPRLTHVHLGARVLCSCPALMTFHNAHLSLGKGRARGVLEGLPGSSRVPSIPDP